MIINKLNTLLTITAMTLLFILNSSQAATIIVNAPNGALDDTDGVCSISEAIINANNDTATYAECLAGNETDTISLSADIVLTTRVDTTFNNTGTMNINSPIILEGNDFELQRDPILNCNLDEANLTSEFRILANNVNGDLTINNLIIKNGCSDSSLVSEGTGGGIYNLGTLNLNNVILENNQARVNGGGIYNIGTIESINNSLLTNNIALSQGGGGITSSGTVNLIENSMFSQNDAANNGGGIRISFSGIIRRIKNTVFTNNTAGAGAGISLNNSSRIDIIENSTFTSNLATFAGGGIYHVGNRIISIKNSTFAQNEANGSGSNNGGGAIYLTSAIISLISNSTFSGNTSIHDGGGILNFIGTLTNLENSTFYENSADKGAAILSVSAPGKTLNLKNSLFINNNSFSLTDDCYTNNTSAFIGNDNLSDDASGGCPGLLVTTLTASTVEALGSNGGTTLTHALLVDSEAIDTSGVNATTSDQRGYSINGTRDIGAYEYFGTPWIFNDDFED